MTPPPETGTRALLDALASGPPDDVVRLGDLFAGLGDRSFGMLLFASIVPAFIPIPIGGAISGPLVILVGLQLLIGLRQPWLPRFLARRGPHRHAVVRFRNLLLPWLTRLEKVVRPRATWMLDRRADLMTGVLLLLLGLLLSLPIPFTNYLFGALLLLFALALLERDGRLMGFAWAAGATTLVTVGLLSGTLTETLTQWLQRVF